MKKSIKHLPKCTQKELNTIIELVTQNIKGVSMIILFGSYARGSYVLYDESIQYGARVIYQSDIDILVVTEKGNEMETENRLRKLTERKYHSVFGDKRHATPQYVSMPIKRLNKELSRSQYFFTDLVKEGIMLYNSNQHELTKPRQLSFKEIQKYAQIEYNNFFPRACRLLVHGQSDLLVGEHEVGAFELHQACERFYNAISLVFTNYRPPCHKLDELGRKVKEFSKELATVFPRNNDFEIHCFNLLCKAYKESRYNSAFKVTKEEYEYMLERVEILKNITERICLERLQYYDSMK